MIQGLLSPAELAEEIDWLVFDEVLFDGDAVLIAEAQALRARKRARKAAWGRFWRRLLGA